MINYNVWQNEYGFTCSRVHKKFFKFEEANQPFLTARNSKNRDSNPNMVRRFYTRKGYAL